MDQSALGNATEILEFLSEIDHVLGFLPLAEVPIEIPLDVQEAFEKRGAARSEKNWAEADSQRDYIHSQGYQIEDTPQGPRLKKDHT